MPDHAFRANAGAEVVADILFLQKREHIVETEDDWIYLGQTDKGYAINTYFLDHPEMILGTLEEQSTQFGKEYTVKADQNQDLSKLLLSAVTKIQGHYEPYEPTAAARILEVCPFRTGDNKMQFFPQTHPCAIFHTR